MKLFLYILYFSLLTALSPAIGADTIQRTIVTSGQGEVSVAPNMAELNMQLQTINKDGNRAKRELDDQFNRLLRALALLDIPKDEIIASSLQLAPHYNYASKKRELVGYRAVRNITVSINKLDQLDEVMATSLAAGIDQLGKVNLKVADEVTYQKLARQRAIDQSKTIASELAQSYGASLGSIITITYKGSDIQYPRPFNQRQRSAMMSSDSDAGIYLHDNIKFNDRISVIFELLVAE